MGACVLVMVLRLRGKMLNNLTGGPRAICPPFKENGSDAAAMSTVADSAGWQEQ